MRNLLLLLACFLISFSSFAQIPKGMDVYDGWACTKKGDTLRGKICNIDPKSGQRLDKIFLFDSANKKSRLGPEKLTSYFMDGKLFEYIIIEEGAVAAPMQKAITGDLCLFYAWFPLMESTPQKYVYEKAIFLKKKDQTAYIEVLEKKFQKNMALYFKGDEDIVQLIKDNKYEAKDIEKIVIAYNEKK
jgi:hypothetical protein